MGTRSSHGFRFQDKDYLTYNHYDGNPLHTGKSILTDLKSISLERMIQLVPELICVSASETWIHDSVTPEDEAIIAQYTDDRNINSLDWYFKLYHAQSKIAPYFNERPLRFMAVENYFLLQFDCEYAYIINLDSLMVEFYVGSNSRRKINSGRYTLKKPGAVYLVGEVPIALIQNLSDEDINEFCIRLEEYTGKVISEKINIEHDTKSFYHIF